MCEPRLAQHVGAHFDHVLVDEYQDTNRLQAEILHALKPDGAGLDRGRRRRAGDLLVPRRGGREHPRFPRALHARPPRSSRWRRTTAPRSRCSMSPTRSWPRRRASTASTCCRCAATARGRVRHRRRAADAGRIRLHARCSSAARRACRSSARRCCSAAPATATCSKSSSRKRKIPFVKYGGLKFLEAAHVKDLLAVLRWADNPRNTLAAFRVLQLLPGMGPVNARARARALARPAATRSRRSTSFKPPQTAEVRVRAADRRCCRRSPSRSASGRARCNWCASGTSRTSSASTSSSTRASATSTSSSCCPRSTPRASASSPSSRSIRRTPPATCRARRARRGLPGALDHPLGQGHGVGHGVRAQRRRRQLPVRVRHRQAPSSSRRSGACCTWR